MATIASKPRGGSTWPLIRDQFLAKLVGEESLSVVGPTREEAVASLKAELTKRVERGELFSLNIGATSVSDVAGKYANDETLEEICAEAYSARDRERDQQD